MYSELYGARDLTLGFHMQSYKLALHWLILGLHELFWVDLWGNSCGYCHLEAKLPLLQQMRERGTQHSTGRALEYQKTASSKGGLTGDPISHPCPQEPSGQTSLAEKTLDSRLIDKWHMKESRWGRGKTQRGGHVYCVCFLLWMRMTRGWKTSEGALWAHRPKWNSNSTW